MTTFPQAGIDTLRAINEANLPDTCTATVPGGEWIPDGHGGGSFTPSESYEFPCRTWPLNAREVEAMVAEQLRQPGLEGLAMPVGQALPGDAVVVITRAGGGSQQYEVVGRVPDPTYAMMSRGIIKRLPDVPEEEEST